MITMTPPRSEETVRRKVTASGVVWLDGQAYYISRRLSGETVQVRVGNGKLVVDALVPLHKEYPLPEETVRSRALRGWRAPRRAG